MTPVSPRRAASLDTVTLSEAPTETPTSEAPTGRLILEQITPTLLLAGDIGTDPTPSQIALVGARLQLAATVTIEGNRWSADIPLLSSRWGGPALAPPSGRYLLAWQSNPLPTPTPRVDDRLITELPDSRLFTDRFTIAFASETGEAESDAVLAVDFSAPLTDSERGPAQQRRLEAAYRSAAPVPLNAVFFESFYGQNASCNPRAIDRELATHHPEIPRYWSVADGSVEVPPGAIALIDGSEQWWNIRASARLLVVNDWLRKRYRRRRHQTVMQTWHGTPLKRIALTRAGLRPRAAIATVRERFRWDILLSQNPYSSAIFRRAYAFRSAWEEGYPRNDVLSTDFGGTRAAMLRERLGIDSNATVVLYAPTWRDDRPNQVDQLDVATFADQLGAGFVTLLRGHSRSLRGGSDLHASNVLDVTTYPDASDLFLVADALVTDYSSVMFDFAVTGKPIYFFTPDLVRYRDQLRGFYFDLLAVSPGPVVHSAAELIEHLRNPERATAEFAQRYAAWTTRFNPRDDGKAAARVVARLLARGAIG